MKLINFLNDKIFNSYRNAMDAPLSQFQVHIVLPKPVFRPQVPKNIVLPLPTEGLDVESSEIKVHSDSTLLYKEKRVLVHIRDATGHEPRFHLSNCITLVDMRNKGRFEKYVVSERDDGYFHVRFNSGNLEQRKLSVCQNCLNELSWDGFSLENDRSLRQDSVRNFSIKDFYKKYPRSLFKNVPRNDVVTAPINNYPENWAVIAGELKRQLGYFCQSCNLVIGEEYKKYLHVHHINGMKNDCRVENLKCLCISCHSDQHQHENLKHDLDFIDFKKLFS